MRGGAFAGVVLATVCGVCTAYATFQPALQEQKERKEGTFDEQHRKSEDQEKILSQAIADDLKEAKKEFAKYDKGRFAWGIRNALFGPPEGPQPPKSAPPQQPEPRNTGT